MILHIDPSKKFGVSNDCQKRIFPIYWEHAGEIYPDKNWFDFSIIILGWWTGRLREIMEGAENVDLMFMDGPYWLSANKISSTEVELTTRQGEFFAKCPVADLVHEVLRGLEATIEVLNNEGGSDTCVQTLNKGLTMLRSAFADYSRKTVR